MRADIYDWQKRSGNFTLRERRGIKISKKQDLPDNGEIFIIIGQTGIFLSAGYYTIYTGVVKGGII